MLALPKCVSALVLGSVLILPGFAQAELNQHGVAPEEVRSLEWLRSQIVPNRFIPTPDPRRRGLILSYASSTGPDGPIHRKSFVYDAAVASIAFGVAGDWARASMVLNALTRVQRRDGSFWSSYNVENAWPEEDDHDMAIVRAGATAWAGYAFTFYLENRPPSNDARFLRERNLFLTAARNVADFLRTLRVTERTDRQGLLRGGRALVRVTSDAAGTVTEVYEDAPMLWISTEHNISSYFFLTALHRLTGDTRHIAVAREIKDKLLSSLWQDDLKQFAQGFLKDGTIDRTRALDCASWGALFLSAVGERDKAAQAVETAEQIYRNSHLGIMGYRPYYGTIIYENPNAQRILLPDAPSAQWQELPFVWSEGTLGVALAHARLGHVVRARDIITEMLKLRDGGGIRYASRELPYEFFGSPSAAGTAWHVIVEEALQNPDTSTLWSR